MARSKKPYRKQYVVHKRLEKPVHSLVGYAVLFLLAIVVFFLVYSLKLLSI